MLAIRDAAASAVLQWFSPVGIHEPESIWLTLAEVRCSSEELLALEDKLQSTSR